MCRLGLEPTPEGGWVREDKTGDRYGIEERKKGNGK